ncbi:5533_t:CDS:2 [Funneliformis geosporum]|uniref:5533_t:CDS:1 n=1 Tax=Funneliformis geosporum TaxID=1117311 RepID=A0A9W4SB06_9GLOM|nr:5533_t:CDS:2 [Funneliformis geosporum]
MITFGNWKVLIEKQVELDKLIVEKSPTDLKWFSCSNAERLKLALLVEESEDLSFNELLLVFFARTNDLYIEEKEEIYNLKNRKINEKGQNTYHVIGIITAVGIGTITYLTLSKGDKSVENQTPANAGEKIRQLRTELSSLRGKVNNLSNTTKKTQLESKLSNLENQLNNLAKQDKSAIQKLENELKKIKKEIESDKPDENPPPGDKKEVKVGFFGKSLNNNGEFDTYKFMDEERKNIFYISKNHSRIKELLNQNKLQKDKEFTLRYGKIDKKEGISEISTKINDNTYKYKITLNGSDKIDFANFIIFLKTKDKEFFKAFQGALKDANAKFPAYFWKCPPVSKNTLGKPFEFVVIKSESLAGITQNYKNFETYLLSAAGLGLSHASFDSPSGNILVIPALTTKDGSEPVDYKNISQFTKNAPEEQQQAL